MNQLRNVIDKAISEQYPNGNKPTFLQKIHKQSDKDRWSEYFNRQLSEAGLVAQKEIRFHPERQWRFDYAFPDKKIGIEIDGGSFGRVVQCHQCKVSVMRFLKDGRHVPIREGGRHNTGAGMEADHEKMNAAVLLGWRILRFVPKHIKDGYAINALKILLKNDS